MTEPPRDPSGVGEPGYGSAPPPPPPAEGQPPTYAPPPAYTPPAPGTEAPAAQPPPVGQPAAGQYGAGYQAPPSGYQDAPSIPPPTYQEQPPAIPGGFQAAASGFGEQFANYDRTALRNFDAKTVNPMDWGIIAAGVVAFIFSLFNFYTASVTIAGFGSGHRTDNAWHGFFGWFGALVALLAALLLAAELIARIRFPFATRLVVLGGFVLALICELLALLIVPIDTSGADGGFIKVDKGHGFGYWITLIAVIVGTGLAFKRFTDTGGKLPRRA